MVCRPVASWLAVWRRCLRNGFLLHRKRRVKIDLRGFYRFMSEPQRDHRSFDAFLHEIHGHRVSQTVDSDLLLLQ